MTPSLAVQARCPARTERAHIARRQHVDRHPEASGNCIGLASVSLSRGIDLARLAAALTGRAAAARRRNQTCTPRPERASFELCRCHQQRHMVRFSRRGGHRISFRSCRLPTCSDVFQSRQHAAGHTAGAMCSRGPQGGVISDNSREMRPKYRKARPYLIAERAL